ncbi:MAG: helix-turn-helix domain-containing protein [Actinobacteria bacterium]|nr:helix-turn-helix domain-containing protein [Actinomycetota bacterium]
MLKLVEDVGDVIYWHIKSGNVRYELSRQRSLLTGGSLLGDRFSNKLLTVNEVANILRVSNMTVYRLVKSGQIPAIRVGKNYRIKESDVNDYLSRGTQRPDKS